jgi:RHS repeat-associated protein
VYTYQDNDWVLTEHRRFVWGGAGTGGWLLLLELDGLNSNAVVRKYTWGLDLAGQSGALNALESAGGIGGLLAISDPNDPNDPNDLCGDFVCLYDANGNVGQLVDLTHDPNDPNGALAAKYQYDPYGNVIAKSGSYADENPIRFSTNYFDDESGWVQGKRRYYDPRMGRWTNRDPKGEVGTANLYAAFRNSPPNLVDPDGRQDQPVQSPGASPATTPATLPTVDKSKACCKYVKTVRSTGGNSFGAAHFSSTTKCASTTSCPDGATDPSECCTCCGTTRSSGVGYFHETVVSLSKATWGTCCFCTATVKRQSWAFIFPHHEFHLTCPASEHGPAFSISLGRWSSQNNWYGFAPIQYYTYPANTLDVTAASKKVTCEDGQRVLQAIKAAYPLSTSSGPLNLHDYEEELFPVEQCRSFAFRWFDRAGEEWMECQ